MSSTTDCLIALLNGFERHGTFFAAEVLQSLRVHPPTNSGGARSVIDIIEEKWANTQYPNKDDFQEQFHDTNYEILLLTFFKSFPQSGHLKVIVIALAV